MHYNKIFYRIVEIVNATFCPRQGLKSRVKFFKIIVETEEIHHKKPLSEGGTHDQSNLIALCKSCHSQIHAKRGDYWGRTMSGGHRSCADRSEAERRG